MATFKKRIKFEKEQDGYSGTYYFNPKTIKTFSPISESNICIIFNKNIKFSQTKHKLDKSFLPKFIVSLKNVKEIDENIIKTKEWKCKKTICDFEK